MFSSIVVVSIIIVGLVVVIIPPLGARWLTRNDMIASRHANDPEAEHSGVFFSASYNGNKEVVMNGAQYIVKCIASTGGPSIRFSGRAIMPVTMLCMMVAFLTCCAT
jgi:hypothetical protein